MFGRGVNPDRKSSPDRTSADVGQIAREMKQLRGSKKAFKSPRVDIGRFLGRKRRYRYYRNASASLRLNKTGKSDGPTRHYAAKGRDRHHMVVLTDEETDEDSQSDSDDYNVLRELADQTPSINLREVEILASETVGSGEQDSALEPLTLNGYLPSDSDEEDAPLAKLGWGTKVRRELCEYDLKDPYGLKLDDLESNDNMSDASDFSPGPQHIQISDAGRVSQDFPVIPTPTASQVGRNIQPPPRLPVPSASTSANGSGSDNRCWSESNDEIPRSVDDLNLSDTPSPSQESSWSANEDEGPRHHNGLVGTDEWRDPTESDSCSDFHDYDSKLMVAMSGRENDATSTMEDKLIIRTESPVAPPDYAGLQSDKGEEAIISSDVLRCATPKAKARGPTHGPTTRRTTVPMSALARAKYRIKNADRKLGILKRKVRRRGNRRKTTPTMDDHVRACGIGKAKFHVKRAQFRLRLEKRRRERVLDKGAFDKSSQPATQVDLDTLPRDTDDTLREENVKFLVEDHCVCEDTEGSESDSSSLSFYSCSSDNSKRHSRNTNT